MQFYKNKSYRPQLLYGSIRCTNLYPYVVFSVFAVKCSICKSVSDTYDPYLDIALEIRVRF